MGRPTFAVVAGFVIWTAIWLVAGQVVLNVFPEAVAEDGRTVTAAGVLLVFLVVSVVASLVSGWVTAVLARAVAGWAVAILALALLAVGIAVEVGSWDHAPVWYHLVFLGLLVPATVAGGSLRRVSGR